MRLGLASGALLMTISCAAVPPQTPPPEETVPVRGAGSCDAAKAMALVGRQSSSELGAEALRLTGSRTLRWIRPGDVWTMDLREDRLNIDLDASGRVRAFRCG